jgi:hypothetical protein
MAVMTDETLRARGSLTTAPLLSSPLVLLAAAIVACLLLLLVPMRLPIGPMYWDSFIYYDAANRISTGQAPILDFFTPVGPLGYYLFAALAYLFPNGQPTLIAHWSLLLVSAPLMALILRDVDQRSRATAFALLIPFLVFALLPFNTREFYPFPGSDGFGIYNRQVCHVLYLLVATLLFVRDKRLLIALTCLCMAALFFLKITGFVAGGIICFYAFLAGRVPLKPALAIAALFVVVLAGLELFTHMVTRYIADILALLQMNSGTIAPRFLQATSLNFGMVAASVGLIGVLAWMSLPSSVRALRPSIASFSAFLNQDWLWIGVVLFAGILFETQNTGSQALIFLWPILLLVLLKRMVLLSRPAVFAAIATLCAAVILPPMAKVTEKAARAYIGSAKNLPLEHTNLKTLGALNMRREVAVRTDHMLKFYPEHRTLYDDMIAVDELPTPVLYSDFDFQVIYLQSIDSAIDAIHEWERQRNIRFDTMMSLNFVNPFPWLMDRQAPLHISIGADPTRAVPAPGSEEEQAAADTDLVLYPTCPPTTANAMLFDMYKPALTKHLRMKLTDCYDAYVHPKFSTAFGQ